jgi:hypothetical protein
MQSDRNWIVSPHERPPDMLVWSAPAKRAIGKELTEVVAAVPIAWDSICASNLHRKHKWAMHRVAAS